MSAALAAAIVRNRPAIGSRHTYTVKGGGRRVKGKNADVTHHGTVTALRPGYLIAFTLDDRGGTILTEWPGWWQDGTMRSEG